MGSDGARPPAGGSGPARESDDPRTLGDRDRELSKRDQEQSDADRALSDRDQTLAGQDEALGDSGSDRQEAPSRGDLAPGDSVLGQPPADPDQAPGEGDSAHEQSLSNRDQSLSNRDQTLSDHDQSLSDRDQEASDEDQAASDQGGEEGDGPASHEHASAIRAGTTQERLAVGHVRDETSTERDRAAEERDAIAAQRDRDADITDRLALSLDHRDALADRHTLRVQELRGRASEARKRASEARERARRDRALAARDRELAARDREEARQELEHAGVDELTGARRRGAGLRELEREIARARRTNQNLVVAYVDVDGLKEVNDEHGHGAGDQLLREAADALRHHMRSYDLLVRLGGDEFLCVLPGVSVEEVWSRLGDLGSELPAGPVAGSVSIGLSELRDGEGAQQLVERADQNLLRARNRGRKRQRSLRGLAVPSSSHQPRGARRISLGNAATPVGSVTGSPPRKLAKLSQYTRADDAPEAVSQYSITLSSNSSRCSTFSGWPSQSIQDQNFSTIQASCATGESTDP